MPKRKAEATTYDFDDGFVEDGAPSSSKATTKSKKQKKTSNLAKQTDDDGQAYWEVCFPFAFHISQ